MAEPASILQHSIEPIPAAPAVAPVQPLDHYTLRDPLTGLVNRVTFAARLSLELERCVNSGHHLAVLFADVDEFGEVNRVHGHDKGDLILIELAAMLGVVLSPADTLARFGGDKFLVICPGLVERGHALTVVDRLRSAASRPIRIGRRTLNVTLSVAVAFAGEGDPHEGARLMARADRWVDDVSSAETGSTSGSTGRTGSDERG